MSRFTSKGMWRIPGTGKKKKKDKAGTEEPMIVKQCFCPNGHNLINPKVNVQGHHGILLKVKRGKDEGFVALSPVCGDKSKYTIDIELHEGEVIEMLCPKCNVPLPIYAPCDCGADMITLFRDKHGNFCNCIGICNRVGCSHSEIKWGTELFNLYRRKGEIRGTEGYI